MMIGQDRLEMLLDHVGKVEENDSFQAALRKVETGKMGQTNQAVSRQKAVHKDYSRLKWVCSVVPYHHRAGFKM